MKNISKIVSLLVFLFLILNSGIPGKNRADYNIIQQDSMQLIAKYSLFSEYYKNNDLLTAYPYGWEVLQMDPKKFAKYIYYKMEDLLWTLHDSSDVAPEMKAEIEDSILHFYDLAIENFPEDKGYFEARLAFIQNNWLNMDADTVIATYEKAIQDNPDLAPYYYDQLGTLYKENMSEENDYQTKAIDLYNELIKREPDNNIWTDKLEDLAEDPSQLVEIMKQSWERDKDNLSKAWRYASMAMRLGDFEEALGPLEFLTQKAPETINYWNQLATAYQKLEQLKKAENALKKLIQLEPDNQNHYLNLGIIYKDQGQLAAARTQYQKASQVGNGWGLPIFYEGLLYEQAARNCGEFNFNAKMAYQLAVDTYRKAANMDNTATQAQERISALSGSIPTQEDYFFRGYKSGQTIPVTGECYDWIGKSITVP